MTKETPKDKTYRLKNGSKPLTYTIPSRNTPHFPLMWYDEKNNINRSLRYAVNQKSPFEDEQDGNAILDQIVFSDGMLFVPKQNPALQSFLSYHPLNGILFEEINKEKEAAKEMENLNNEVDALIAARQLSIDQVEMLTRVMFGKDPSLTTTAELKRDILVFAKIRPEEFLNMLNDPELKFQAKVHMFFDKGFLILKNNNKEIWFNTAANKKKMCSILYGDDQYQTAISFLQSDEGIEALKMLETLSA